jgi:FAD/FMN-containing dehydrogenase/Fe-S oxidoreductase
MSVAELPVVSSSPEHRPVDVAAVRAALEKTTCEVRFDRLSRALYSTDASVYQIVPLGVVIPRSPEDVVAVVKLSRQFHLPLTARGGGTSQAGQAIGSGLILDCSKYLDRILAINPAERWVRVQPGVVLDDLNLELKKHGLHFPHDVSTSGWATLGGMIANNSSGTHSVLYGKTIDHVLELTVVLSDGSVVQAGPLSAAAVEARCARQDLEGACYRVLRRLAAEHADEIDRRFPKILRRVGGYNLDRFTNGGDGREFSLVPILVGSEGTLAITLEAKLRVVELPRARAVVVLHFHDLLQALAATPAILAHHPSAVEVIDRYVLDSTKLNAEAAALRDFLQGEPAAILIVEFYGQEVAELPSKLDALVADMQQQGFGYHAHRALEPAAQARIWKLRKLALGLSMAQKGDAKAISFVEDTAVAPAHLRDFIAEFLEVIRRHGTTAGVYAHASVGCLHVRPVVNLKTEAGVRQFEAIAGEVADLVLRYGGALSGEHGDGLVRSPFMAKMFGPVLYGAFQEIKRTFDPLDLLNPGKIVDAPPLTANLRYGATYVTPSVPTTFDFAADGSIVQAAELCAGVGQCRKKRDGIMCPSYQATRDERDCTRGRANTLRLALTGQVGFDGLTDPAVKEVLDLCLECKACKAECPTNTDMARLKAEFLHQYYQEHGLPWRNWIFGNVRDLTQHGGSLANWLMRTTVGRWLNDKLLGIDRRRLPPPLAKQPFNPNRVPDPDRPGTETAEETRPCVGIFPDTFMVCFEPEIGEAVLTLVRRAGVTDRVGFHDGHKAVFGPPEDWPWGLRCCGRPLISNGMLDKAVALARANVRGLFPFAAAGKPIIACEPSCILTIKDDYPALLRGEERQKAEGVAAQCFTFEDFLERTLASGERQLAFRPGPKTILVQGHCHQRSLVGMSHTIKLLQRIPGAEVIDLDSGCCGMAGSFGYEKEHYEISRLIGEQRLFPAIRRSDPQNTVIVAPGFSCRLQIEHFTGRKALHPAQLLRKLLVEP